MIKLDKIKFETSKVREFEFVDCFQQRLFIVLMYREAFKGSYGIICFGVVDGGRGWGPLIPPLVFNHLPLTLG